MSTYVPFSSETYLKRRKTFIDKVGDGVYLFLSNDEVAYNYTDNVFPYRQDSSFLYYFGLNLPGIYGIIDATSGRSILFADDIDINMIIWTGPQPSARELGDLIGIDKIIPVKNLEKEVDQNTNFLPPYRHVHTIFLSNLTGIPVTEIAERVSRKMIHTIIDQRSCKSLEELNLLHEATSISEAMHLEVMKAARPGLKEYEMVGLASKVAFDHHASWSFPPIMSINGQTLHNHSHENELIEGRLLLFDGGCEHKSGYAGDLTRTYPVSKKFTTKQKEIYAIVLDAQQKAIDKLAPDVTYKSIHLLAAMAIFDGLKELGITRGSTEEAVDLGAHALFFPHGLGHMIGLDVHDMENLGEDLVGYDNEVQRSAQFGLKSLRLGKKLKPGHVITVEPGIYFIPELIDLWKKESKFDQFINFAKLEEYRDFGGIRIEDDYSIDETKGKKLGKINLPKTISDIENLRN